MLITETPTRLRLVGYEDRRDALEKLLTFRRSSAVFAYEKFKKNKWAARTMQPEDYRARLEELKEAQQTCLLYEDEDGLWTFTGLKELIANRFMDRESKNLVTYPEPKIIAWDKVPEHTMRPYQREALDKLLEVKHGAVEMGTGVGKSFIILNGVKELALQTVVMAPSVSIASQLYEEFKEAFGKKHVGMVGDGKKDFKKRFVIGIAASLAKIEEGSEMWNHLAKADVFIADESHLTPAEQFEKVCNGLLKNAPYRWFFSGTQLRNDGADLLLKAITGPIVFTMTVREGVDQGYLAKPVFKMIRVTTTDRYISDDAQRMTRKHFLYNKKVNQIAAQMANMAVEYLGHQVVILVDEMEQLTHLLPYLNHEFRFAHGGVTKDNADKIPKEYHESDPKALVKQFNKGEFPILIGTSCINTGTDIQTVETIINLQGGKSPIKFAQSVGRGTRKTKLKPSKTECFFIDFDVRNALIDDEYRDVVHRHAMERVAIYNSIYGPVDFMDM